ncbi:hypothetical protein J6590_053847 [Homalodisca vitripennis]|nr:hypothetical protein J6590_053847 [Homalodisca vitripennis]
MLRPETARRQYVLDVDSYNRPRSARCLYLPEAERSKGYQGPRTTKTRNREILETDTRGLSREALGVSPPPRVKNRQGVEFPKVGSCRSWKAAKDWEQTEAGKVLEADNSQRARGTTYWMLLDAEKPRMPQAETARRREVLEAESSQKP